MQDDITPDLAGGDTWGNFAEDGCVEQKLLDELATKGMHLLFCTRTTAATKNKAAACMQSDVSAIRSLNALPLPDPQPRKNGSETQPEVLVKHKF